jgi:hypothetical protein
MMVTTCSRPVGRDELAAPLLPEDEHEHYNFLARSNGRIVIFRLCCSILTRHGRFCSVGPDDETMRVYMAGRLADTSMGRGILDTL